MMKKNLLFVLSFLLYTTSVFSTDISLEGKWRFKLDPNDIGEKELWYQKKLSDKIQLPGSLQEQGYGNDVELNTVWIGTIHDKQWLTSPKFEKYREKGNVSVPFWLNPAKHYVGVAWYQKEFNLPTDWAGSPVVLMLERTHWETTLYVDGVKIGESNTLSVPTRYVLKELKSGKHVITIRVDNRINIPVGVDAHSISDHTQTNWNGIIGTISLQRKPQIYMDDVQIFADVKQKKMNVNLVFDGESDAQAATLCLQAFDQSGNAVSALSKQTIQIAKGVEYKTILNLNEKVEFWSEFTPSVYTLKASVKLNEGMVDQRNVDFGLRDFKANGTRFEVNGMPVFLRGTLECCIFPLTGYPAMDDAYWEKIYKTCKEYGLNHVRFHSWCPPEAAFRVADRMGFYLLVECGGWTTVGNGGYIDKWFYEEGNRILKEYGNHPSFCMMSYGNEPNGNNQARYLADFVTFFKEKDNRRAYTSAAGWPYVPEADFHVPMTPRIQVWGAGLKSLLNAQAPTTDYDFWHQIKKDMPTISHEIGQWCVYPDFKEIEKYTGVLKAKNFLIFKETLTEKNMLDLADEFLYASGRLQTLCYKMDIEAALRTPGFAGFQLLDLHDFPGQGTALVGVLNPFWESKGYVDGEEYRTFCNSTVPLARLPKTTFLNTEKLKASLEFAHFAAQPLKNACVYWNLQDKNGKQIKEGSWIKDIPINNSIIIGNMECDLAAIQSPECLTLTAGVKGTDIKNSWHIWVYPPTNENKSTKSYLTNVFDEKAISKLENGEDVLLCVKRGSLFPEKGGNIKVGFSSIFWNTAWTNKQPPHTLGIYCNPNHPALALFPTEKHSDFQWWDIVSDCEAIVLDDFPATYRPIVHLIDDWVTNRKLGLLFEAKVGKGRLIVCGANLLNLANEKIASKQFKESVLNYMNSDSFNPQMELSVNQISSLFKK